jgi:hypothetical protein
MERDKPSGKEQMKRFEDLLQRLFTVVKDDLEKADEIAEEIEEVIERQRVVGVFML